MPVKSPAATPTTPRKRRTRKTLTKTARVNKVIKEVQAVLDAPRETKPAKAVKKVTVTTFKGGKVVSKVTTLKRPSTARLITPSRYWSDIKTRWQIHNYEITMLVSDLTKGLRYVRQFTN